MKRKLSCTSVTTR